MTIALALATAAGIGTGPAPIINNGSSGRIASSDTTSGQGMEGSVLDMVRRNRRFAGTAVPLRRARGSAEMVHCGEGNADHCPISAREQVFSTECAFARRTAAGSIVGICAVRLRPSGFEGRPCGARNQPADNGASGECADAPSITGTRGATYPHKLVSKAASRSCTSTGNATAPA